MGTMIMVDAFLPVMLFSAIGVAVFYLFKSPWFKGVAGTMLVHLCARTHLNCLRGNIPLATAGETPQIDPGTVSKIPECRGTTARPFKDGAIEMGSEAEPGFTDSWTNMTWRDEEMQAAFTDGAFRQKHPSYESR